MGIIKELHLYTEYISERAIKEVCDQFSKRHDHINIKLNRVEQDSLFWCQEENIIVSDLCQIPYWCLEFTSASSVEDTVYQVYRHCVDKGWNVCLYEPQMKAVFVPFNKDLLAFKVAHLWYREGSSSDKVYHLYLVYDPTEGSYSVVSRYGRRGGKLHHQEKGFDTSKEEAEREWDRIYQSKLRKGYKVHKALQEKQLELVF
jgi:predicted DNA-binding WGR domain protein